MEWFSAKSGLLAAGVFGLATLASCSYFLVYAPSKKYDGKIVRGEVTYLASKEDLRKNWSSQVAKLPDAPGLDDYLANYSRAAVTIEDGFGYKMLVYPFIESNQSIDIGAIVDIQLDVGGPLMGKFAGRQKILRVVCEAKNDVCRNSVEGRKRGKVPAGT